MSLERILAEASERRQQGIPYPVRRESLSYPIDVSNHFCDLDCAFDARIRAIEAARVMAVPEAAELAAQMVDSTKSLKPKRDQVLLMYQQTEAAHYMIDASEVRGEYLPKERRKLEKLQASIRNDNLIKQTDNMITAAEYMVGIRREPLPIPTEVLSACKASGVRFDLDIYKKQLNQPASEITALPLTFECMDVTHYMDAMRYSDPNRYASDLWVVTPTTLDSYHEYVENTAKESVRRDLAIFDQLDSMAIPADVNDGNPISREDLIFINGCSLRQLVDLSAGPNTTPEERRAAGVSVLSQAVLNPKDCYVEAFLPDSNSKSISTTPVPLTVLGEKAPEMEAPKMNAWQRFWTKHGHYKELATRVQQYETIQEYREQALKTALPIIEEVAEKWEATAAADIREAVPQRLEEAKRARDNVAISLFGEEFFDPDIHSIMMRDHGDYHISRSGVNLGICLMLHEGMNFEQIMDPTYEPVLKQNIGTHLLDLAQRNDPVEFCDFVLPAVQEILDMPNLPIDYSNPAEVLDHLEEIQFRKLTFDMLQETTYRGSAVRMEVESRVGDMDAYQSRLHSHGEFYDRLSNFAEALGTEGPYLDITGQLTPESCKQFSDLAIINGLTQKYGAQLNAGIRPHELGDISKEIVVMDVEALRASRTIPPSKSRIAIDMMTAGKSCVEFTPNNPKDMSRGMQVAIHDPAAPHPAAPVQAKKIEEPVRAGSPMAPAGRGR